MKMRMLYSVVFLVISCTSQSFVISLEGNCGAGKTTLANILTKELNTPVIPEQWPKWMNKKLFESFLQDKSRWAYAMANFIAAVRFQACNSVAKAYPNAPLFILDRSVFTQVYGFSRMLYGNGSLTELEWGLFLEQTKMLMQMLNYTIDGFVYVKTDVDTCYERIQKRKPYNEYLTHEFLTSLGACHERWLVQKDLLVDFKDAPVLVIDGTKDFQNDPLEQQRIIAQVREFVMSLR